jgi:hypothetical protein
MDDLSARLRKLIEKKSAAVVIRESGLHRSSIYDVLRGERPGRKVLAGLARAGLRVTVGDVTGGAR